MTSALFIAHWFVASVLSSFMAVSDSDVRSSWGFRLLYSLHFSFSIASSVDFSVASSSLSVSSFLSFRLFCRLDFFFFFRFLGLFPVAYWVAY